MTANGFDMWGIVEIMGHQRCAGKLSEQSIAGAAMLRVDVPKTPEREGFTKFYSAAAIYAITPTDEATATKAAIAFEVTPIQEYILRVNSPALAEKIQDPDLAIRNDYEWKLDDDDDYYDDEEEDETEPKLANLQSIVSMERGETNNSKSPMWRCLTGHGERVNVFKHADPKKDTFNLFNVAGYGPMMELMKVGDVLLWKQFPIHVHMEKKDGWWNVVRVYEMPVGAKPELPPKEVSPKQDAAEWAKTLVDAGDFVVLDCETTGLNDGGKKDEPVQIAVVSSDGTALFNSLIKPMVSIDDEAAATHHITADMLADAPRFDEVREKLVAVLKDKHVIIYNIGFDAGILDNVAGNHMQLGGNSWQCAMYQYSLFYGEPYYKGGWKSQSLTKACDQQGIGEATAAHSALGDCLRTLALIKVMAAYEAPQTNDHPF